MRVNLPEAVTISNLRDGSLSFDGGWGPGEADVPDRVGDLLVRQGLASPVDPAVPEAPRAIRKHVAAPVAAEEE